MEKFRKDPQYQVSIGRAYYRNRDYSKAEKFIGKALDLDRNFAPAYILRGDMAALDKDSATAMDWYQQAITANPKSIDAYTKFVEIAATRNPGAADIALKQLGENIPGYPVEMSRAYVWFSSRDWQKAIDLYAKVDSTKMDEDNSWRYAFALFFNHNYEQSWSVTEKGLDKYPDNIRLCRAAMYNLAALKKYQEAYDYGTRYNRMLLSHRDFKRSSLDYVMFTTACNGVRKYDESFIAFADFLNNDTAYDQSEIKQVKDQLKSTISGLEAGGEFATAADGYRLFLKQRASDSPYDWYELVQIYRSQVQDAVDLHTGEQEAYAAFDKASAEFEQKFSTWDQLDIVYYYHAAYAATILDPQAKTGAAAPLYTKLLDFMATQKEEKAAYKQMRSNAYSYLMIYNFFQDRYKDAARWARKLLAIDPNDENAKRIVRAV